MEVDRKSASSSLMDIPFKALCDALRDLRAAGSTNGRRGKAGGRVSIAKQHKQEVAGVDTVALAASYESKYDVLTRFWKEVAGQLRNVEDRRRGLGPAGRAGGKCVKDEDVVVEEEEEFRPSSALPVDVTEKLLKMLCPGLDDSHSLYSMKEKRVSEHYVDALSLPRYASDAQWLLNYASSEMQQKAATAAGSNRRKKRAILNARNGVFVSVLQVILLERARKTSDKTLSIGKVWELLTTLHDSKEATGSKYLAQGHAKYGADEPGDRAASLIPWKRSIEEEPEDPEARKRRIVAEKKDARMGVFQHMIDHATAAENAEFARLILKDTEVKLKEVQLLKWFHPDAKQYYDCTHKLKRLIVDVRDPSFSMKSVGIEPGTPCAVMNTARPAKSNLEKLAMGLRKGTEGGGGGIVDTSVTPYFYMEPKFDGERMQLHKIGSRVLTFTRNRKDSSAIYGALLKPAILASVRAQNCILDGEIMIWDETSQKWSRFEDIRPILQDMNDRNVRKGERYSLKFCVFDMLYVEQKAVDDGRGAATVTTGVGLKRHSSAAVVGTSNQIVEPSNLVPSSYPTGDEFLASGKREKTRRLANHSLVDYSLILRKKLLNANVKDYATEFSDGFRSCVSLVVADHGSTEADLVRGLTEFVQSGYEGLIAKAPMASYGMGERKPDKAIKLKPDYFEGGLQDIDVIILASKYGTGTGQKQGRVGTLSSFLIGVRTHNSNRELLRYQRGEDCSWTPVGSVGTGYSKDELEELQRQLEPHWHDLEDTSDREKFPEFWDARDQADTMFSDCAKWIHPRDSVVLTVRAYELARRQGYALRFPRCDQIRYGSEKPFYDAISLEELVELDDCKAPAVVRRSGDVDEDEVIEEDVSSRKRKRTTIAQEIAEAKLRDTNVTRAGGARQVRDPTKVQAKLSDIKKEDRLNVLAGRYFRVLARTGDGDAKHVLERSLYRLGASLTQDNRSSEITDFLALDAEHNFVINACRSGKRNATEAGRCSILRPEWLTECENTRSAVPLKRKHVFYANEQLDAMLSRHTDIYGDPWTPTTTSASFIASLTEMDEMMSRKELPRAPAVEDAVIEKHVSNGMRAAGMCFWGICAYFPTSEEAGHSPTCTSTQALIRFFGGNITNSIGHGRQASHVVVHESCPLAELEYLSSRALEDGISNVVFVSNTWVQRCVDERRLLIPFVNGNAS